MKHSRTLSILSLIIILTLFPFVGKAQCDPIHTLPYSNSFPTTVFPPECWTTSGNGWGIEYWDHSSAPYSARVAYTNDAWLISPAIMIPDKGYPVLEFRSLFKQLNWYGSSEILVSTTSNAPNLSAFTVVKTWTYTEANAVGQNWRTMSIPLNDFKGETVYIAFRFDGGNAHEWLIDDITIKVNSDVPVITTGVVEGGIKTLAYSKLLTASGNIPIIWSILEGELPTGLMLNSATGEVYGTPTISGNYNFTVKAQNNLGTDTKAFSMIVRDPILPLITTTALPEGWATAGYKYTLSATGDTPFTWSVQSGALPTGLTLNASTGVISGKPSSAGTYNFTIRAANFAGFNDKALSLTVGAAPYYDPISVQVIKRMITNNGLQANPDDPASWSFVTWTTVPQTYYGYQPLVPYEINVSNLGLTGIVDLSGINEHILAAITDPYYLMFDHVLLVNLSNNSITGLDITGVTFGDWGGITVNNQTLTRVFTEVAPSEYTTNIQFNKKPEFFTGTWGYHTPISALSYENGVLTSTDYLVAQAQYFAPAVGVSSGIYILGNINFTYIMTPVISTTSVPKGTVGIPYTATLNANGGVNPVTWSKTGGDLPAGLTLSASGVISGTPGTAGNFTFTATATNTTGATSKTFNMSIYEAGLEYDPAAVEVVNNLINNNTMQLWSWSSEVYNQPSTWNNFATWNNEQPKKLTQLYLSSRGLSGIASFVGLDELQRLYIEYNGLNGVDLTGLNPSSWYSLSPQILYTTLVGYVPSLWTAEIELKDVTSLVGVDNVGHFYQSGISYANGVLTVTRGDLEHIEFTLASGIPGVELYGYIYFNYANLFDYDANAITVMNDLIVNHNLGNDYILKDNPISWEQNYILEWNYNTYPYQISWINIGGYPVTGNANISGLLSMTKFECDYTNLTGLTISNCPTMTGLYCSSNNQMTALSVSGAASLEYLHCYDNKIANFNLTGCPKLKELQCQYNLIPNLDATPFSKLQTLYCYYNKLTSLNVTGLSYLQYLDCSYNHLTELNLTGLDAIGYGDFHGYEQAVHLTLSGNAGAGYMVDLSLNTPVFGSNDLTYAGGVLKSSNNTLFSTWFNVYTNKEADYYGWLYPLEMAGAFYFEYEEVTLPPVIKTTTLPSCLRGTPYHETVIVTGDIPMTLSVVSGNLPDGLTLNTNSGEISGTPTLSGIFNFTVKATNPNGEDTKALSIEIITPIAPVISTNSLPPALLNLSYTQTLTATGDAPITWEVISGNLPYGMSLNAETGEISGFASTVNSFTFTIKAGNNGGEDTKTFTLDVHAVTYDPVAVDAINNLIQNHNLNFTYNDPASWEGYNLTWDYSSPRQLTYLNLSYRPITGVISLAGLSKMTELMFASNAQATELDISGANALKKLQIDNTLQLTTLNLIGCTNLEEIYIDKTQLTSLNVEGFTYLKWLFCEHSSLTELNVNGCPNLSTLYVPGNNLTELEVTTCSSLLEFFCNNNHLAVLDVRNLTELEYLYCNDNQLTKLYLGGNEKLWGFDAKNNHLSELDYTGCLYFSPSASSLSGQTVSVALTESATNQYIAALPLLYPTFGNSAISHSEGIIKSTNSGVTSSTFSVVPLNDMVIKYPQWPEYWGSKLSGAMTFEYLPASAPAILETPLANGYIGVEYSHTFVASGLIPITWEILSGALPNGLTLNGTTGEISGVPTVFGTFSFTMKATNPLGSDTKPFTLVINDCAISAFPFYEGFKSAVFPPRCWEHVQVSGSVNWIKTSGYSQSGSVAYHDSGYGAVQESWLITPQITIPATGIYFLEFGMQIWGQSSYSLDGSSVWVSTTGTSPQNFTDMIKSISGNEVSSNWVYHNISLEQYAGQTIYLGFRYKGENAHVWVVSDVKVYEQPFSVVSLLPAANTYNVSITPTIRVTFNGEITANDLSGVTINGVSVTPTINGTMLNIPFPAEHLDFYTAYTVNIPADAIVGYDQAITWTFTTIQEPAQTLLLSTVPVNNTRGIALNTPITAFFNKNITSSNLSAITINGQPLTQTPVINGLTLTIPHDIFDYGTTYTVLIPANTINGYNSDYSWTFTTECVEFTEFPLIEQFKTEAFPPDCWQHFQVLGTRAWALTYAGLSGSGAGISSFSDWDHRQEAWLVVPKVTLPASGNFSLQFKSSISDPYYYGEGNRNATCDIFVSTQSPDPASGNYVLVKHLDGADISTAWQTLSVSLNSFLGNNVYIAFRYAGFEGAGWSVDDVYVYDVEDIDVELAEIELPTVANCQGNQTVRVWIRNIGTMPVSGIQLQLKVNGITVATEPYLYTLPRWDQDPDYPYYTSKPFTFAAKADLSGNGEHNITVSAIAAGDRVPENSTKTKILSTAVSTFPWTEPFASFLPTCWETAQVAGNGFWERRSDAPTHNGAYAARRNNATPVGVEQKNWLITKPVKIPATGSYVLQFMSYIGNPGFYYTGAGEGRSRIYVSTTTSELSQFQELYLLQGNDVKEEWQPIRVSLAQFAGQTIYFGFLYSGMNDHEWRIDDVTVLDFESYVDAQVVSIITPTTGENLTNHEQVKVLLKNNGGSALSNFNLKMYLGGVGVANETFTGSIPSLGTAEYTFTTTLDLSIYKPYQIMVTVEAENDQIATNNTITCEVVNTPAGTLANFIAYRFYDEYENDMSFVSFNNVQPHLLKTEAYFDPTSPFRIITAGEYVNGYYYVYTALFNGFYFYVDRFMKIIPETWNVVSSVAISNVPWDMAYDYSTNTMFGITNNSLVDINIENGVMKDIGAFGRDVVAIACNFAGNLFVVDINGDLCAVNKETAALTVIGSTGITTNENIQSMAFHHQSGRLFWAAQDDNANMSRFCEVNTTTGHATVAGNIAGNAQIFALYSPFVAPVLVTKLTPLDGATQVALNSELSVNFNQNVTAANLSGITITPSVTGVLAKITNYTLSIAHNNFQYGTTYTVNIPAGAVQGYNQAIAWSFTTLPEPVPVQVVSTLPANNATNVALNAEVSVTFNQNVSGPLTGITINGNAATGTVSGNKLTIAHSNFAYETQYTVVVPANAITGYNQQTTWSFTTLSEPPPPIEVVYLLPANNAENIALNAEVAVTFSQNVTGPLTGITINGTAATGTISGDKLTMAHDDFEYETEYRVMIPAGAIDNYNEDITWLFTTEKEIIPPTYTVTASVAGNGGTIDPIGVITVEEGSNLTFTITPDENYNILQILINGNNNEEAIETGSYTFSNIVANHTIEASFEYVGISENSNSPIRVFSHLNIINVINDLMVPIKEVAVLDMLGRTIWQGAAPNTKTEIVLNAATGIYAVRITTENTIITSKVTIKL